jgi:hypothetical protein
MDAEDVMIRRLSDLRRAQPADATLRNLIDILQAKLELSARLPVLVFEAEDDGDHAGAQLFRSLVASEKRQINTLLDGLRAHLEARQDVPAATSADTRAPSL